MTTATLNTASLVTAPAARAPAAPLLSSLFSSLGKSLEMAREVGDGSLVSAAKVAKVRAIAATL